MPHDMSFHDGPPIRIKGGSLEIHSKLFLNTEQKGENFIYERKVKVKRIVVIDSCGEKYEPYVEDGKFEIEFYLERRRR